VIVVRDPQLARADLARGQLPCPDCGTPLRPWGAARARVVRQADGTLRRLRPDRARCPGCRHTHVLLPVTSPPRSGYALDVVAAALVAHARGSGHRPIAAALRVPADTVRGWLRRARRGLETIRRKAADQLAWADQDVFARLAPQPTLLGEYLNTLLAAADATVRRLRLTVPGLWPVAAMICGGCLLPDTGS
jgi:transposase-like protein